jgi:hypothetical protein
MRARREEKARAALIERVDAVASDHVHYSVPPRWAEAVIEELGGFDIKPSDIQLEAVLTACRKLGYRTCDPDEVEEDE